MSEQSATTLHLFLTMSGQSAMKLSQFLPVRSLKNPIGTTMIELPNGCPQPDPDLRKVDPFKVCVPNLSLRKRLPLIYSIFSPANGGAELTPLAPSFTPRGRRLPNTRISKHRRLSGGP